MNIVSTQYALNRETLEIYLSGCNFHCPDCQNQELWDFNVGSEWSGWLLNLEHKLKSSLVREIWILGGEVLHQDHNELINFLKFINKFNKPVWLWTGVDTIEEIPNDIIELVNYVKLGKYNKDLEPIIDQLTGIKLASSNQRIIKIK